METQNNPDLFIDTMDQDTRGNILRLDQKLKGLLAEINAKLDDHLSAQDSTYKEQLNLVADEVNIAIKNIEQLVTLANTHEEFPSKDRKEFSRFLAKNLKQISKIKEKF